MQLYRAYGMLVASARPLPFIACAAAGARPDVAFLFAERSATRLPGGGEDRRELTCSETGWSLIYVNRAGGWFRFDHDAVAGTLLISSTEADEVVEMALIGVVCATLLSRQGRTLLHGAAVAAGGAALAILGDSGRGKSTLAAALMTAGARLLSEDIIATEPSGDAVLVHAGYDRISLLADSLAALGLDQGDAGARLRPGSDKLWLATAAFGAAPPPVSAPLRAIYILAAPDPQTQASVAHPVPARTASLELVRHLYGSSWMRPVSPADLAYCASLAARVPVFRLARPLSLAAVGDTARMLIERSGRLP